ncbi:endonuclease-reverse transcriptase [Plakobranchus ocellatus]|uniref:Endonuclease-reverse transcriptase n=1 Tax=Plakobranchus ocellatus TaxID=259542 RepID=A0AAV4A7X3_9GAST|nr:endonuclease-reverse transcriptase [Plakobranchus ocellatus]
MSVFLSVSLIVVSVFWWCQLSHDIILFMIIQSLYGKKTISAVFYIRIWFRKTVGVCQGCLLSSTLFTILLERIMTETLEDHEGTVPIGGRTLTNLRFADGKVGVAEKEEELAKLTERLDKISRKYGMEINAGSKQEFT